MLKPEAWASGFYEQRSPFSIFSFCSKFVAHPQQESTFKLKTTSCDWLVFLIPRIKFFIREIIHHGSQIFSTLALELEKKLCMILGNIPYVPVYRICEHKMVESSEYRVKKLVIELDNTINAFDNFIFPTHIMFDTEFKPFFQWIRNTRVVCLQYTSSFCKVRTQKKHVLLSHDNVQKEKEGCILWKNFIKQIFYTGF